MTQKQYVIELGIQLDKKWQHDAMAKAVKVMARSLYLQAVTMAWGGEKPRIAVFSDDFFTGHEELSLADWAEKGAEIEHAKKAKKDYGKVKDFGFEGRVRPSDYMPDPNQIDKRAKKAVAKALLPKTRKAKKAKK